jgi:AsmA protein
VVNTTGTSMMSPLLRVEATGKANLVDETLDFRVEPKVVSSLKGQGGTQQMSGITVPILVTGTFSSPSFAPDMRGVLEKNVEERLLGPKGTSQGGQSTEQKAKELLKGLPFMSK